MIDMHTHLACHSVFPPYFLNGIWEDMYHKLPERDRTEAARRMLESLAKSAMSDCTAERQLKQMDEAGITKSVLLIIDFYYGTFPDPIREVHELHNRVMKNHPGRFEVFSGIDPRRGAEGLALLKQSLEEYHFKGLKLYPPCGFELNDRALWPYYELCKDYGVPVLAHTGPSLPSMRLPTELPKSLAQVAQKFGNMKFIAAHALLDDFEMLLEMAVAYKNLYLEISGFQKAGTGSMEYREKLKKAFDVAPEKILFGSDWPLFNLRISNRHWLAHLKKLEGVGEEKWNLLLRDNAIRLLN